MYKLNEAKFYYDEADNIGVCINAQDGKCYTFNKVGTILFKNIINGIDIPVLMKAIKPFIKSNINIEEKLEDFVDQLKKREIIISSNEKTNNPLSIKDNDFEEGLNPTIEEFSDVQDLIIADPVHDVDEFDKWPDVNKK